MDAGFFRRGFTQEGGLGTGPRATMTHGTVALLKARRSPKNYLDIMGSLQAYDMVLKELHINHCPLY
jgi:hypothetical protein